MRFNNIFNLNYLFIFVTLLLICIGVAALYSAGEGSFYPWSIKHLIRFSVFFIGMIVIALVDIKLIFKYSYLFFIILLVLLFSVEIIGSFGKGAERWIRIFGVSIQPSELIKVGIITALAKHYHSIKYDNIGNLQHLIVPLFIIFIPFSLVIIQPDLGTSLSIFLLGILIMFASGLRIWKFALGLCVGLISLPFLWNYLKPYQQSRIKIFLNPDLDPLGKGYHIIQSKIAIGSGGIRGNGFLGGSQSSLDFIPEKETDFAFSIFSEQFGFIGALILLLIFLILILTPIISSLKIQNTFIKIALLGFSVKLLAEVFINVGMTLGILPVVGVALPFMSYGGSSLLSNMIICALIINFMSADKKVKYFR